mgnify:CR=1 FL=1
MNKIIENMTQCEALYLFCDIRGFSSWMEKNQFEANELLEVYYSSAFTFFGERKSQNYHSRVAKLLGDGFFGVYEYEKNNNKMLKDKINDITGAITTFRISFYDRLSNSTLHGKNDIKCSYGLSYGPCMRIKIPGYSLDYVSHKINYASRLVNVANNDEVVFEIDLWEYIKEEEVFNKRKEKRELKKMGMHNVGIFDSDI